MEATIDFGPEWRSVDPEREARRRRADPLIEAPFLPHTIVPGDLGVLQAKILREAAPWAVAVMRVCQNYGLPARVCQDALRYARALNGYRLAVEKRALVAAYAAALLHGHPSAQRLREALEKAYPRYWGAFMYLSRKGMPVREDRTGILRAAVAAAVKELGLPESVHALALRVAAEIARRVAARSPSIAAASVYVAANTRNCRVTMERAGRAAGVTDATVRNVLQRAGVEVVYTLGDLELYRWRSGGDTVGLLMPVEACTYHGIGPCRPRTVSVVGARVQADLEPVDERLAGCR